MVQQMKKEISWVYLCIIMLVLGTIIGALGNKAMQEPLEYKIVPTKVICEPKECTPCNCINPFEEIENRIKEGKEAETIIKEMIK